MIKEYERKRATEDPLDVKAERMEKLYGPLCSQCGEHEKEHPIGDCEQFVA